MKVSQTSPENDWGDERAECTLCKSYGSQLNTVLALYKSDIAHRQCPILTANSEGTSALENQVHSAELDLD